MLAILAAQNKQLAKLAEDSDTSLEPLARERAHLVGFLRNSATVNSATAERGTDLERNIELLPQTLREVRSTMTDLGTFSDAARPVFSELLGAAPAITRLTRATPAFSKATTISLKSLGDAAEIAGPNIRAADPVVLQLRKLANVAQSPSRNLRQLLFTLRKTGGYDALMKFIYNGATTDNGFDKFGHYQRTNILISSCVQYAQVFNPSCSANFGTGSSASQPRKPRGDPQDAPAGHRPQWRHPGGARHQRQRRRHRSAAGPAGGPGKPQRRGRPGRRRRPKRPP